MAKRVVDVLLPVALDHAYSYRVPEEMELAPGDVVSVPLGARAATAVVWAHNLDPNPRLDNRLKDVDDKLEVPALRPELRRFVDWVSASRRAAWCCACACAGLSILALRASASACGITGRPPGA